jgi:hypothetical protein
MSKQDADAKSKKKQDEYHNKLLQEMLMVPENQQCADCFARGRIEMKQTGIMILFKYRIIRTSLGFCQYRMLPM